MQKSLYTYTVTSLLYFQNLVRPKKISVFDFFLKNVIAHEYVVHRLNLTLFPNGSEILQTFVTSSRMLSLTSL